MAFLKRRLSNFHLNITKDKDKDKDKDKKSNYKTTDKFLSANIPQCVNDKNELKLMHWIFNQQHEEPEANCIKHIKRISRSDAAHNTRKRPQWVTSYYEEDKTLLVWIYGTRNAWDWINLLNVCHKQIHLNKPQTHSIKVHNGVYNAINNILFYAPLFADIHIHFMDPNQDIDQIIFSGHSQGAAISQLMYILWHSEAKCDFVDYFKKQIAETNVIMNLTKVYTLGSIHCISHNSMIYVDNIFGDSIINVINPMDPIPKMYGGNKLEPKMALTPSKKLTFSKLCINGYGKALMDNFYKVASFGPIGKFIVFVDNELRVLHRKDDKFKLFHNHLVHGAVNNFATKKKWTDLPTLKNLYKHHLYLTYKANLDHILFKYIANLE